ncbi:MAG: hypothetical protein KAJ10_10750 [Thermodesulfovibrionia bacterium]|nr:hypothetical protein [Thermodesulfovibrionia bacterium]
MPLKRLRLLLIDIIFNIGKKIKESFSRADTTNNSSSLGNIDNHGLSIILKKRADKAIALNYENFISDGF